jgi:hypothetical protein
MDMGRCRNMCIGRRWIMCRGVEGRDRRYGRGSGSGGKCR